MHLDGQQKCRVGTNVHVAELAHLHNTASPLNLLDKLSNNSSPSRRAVSMMLTTGLVGHGSCYPPGLISDIVCGAETHQRNCVRCSWPESASQPPRGARTCECWSKIRKAGVCLGFPYVSRSGREYAAMLLASLLSNSTESYPDLRSREVGRLKAPLAIKGQSTRLYFSTLQQASIITTACQVL